MGPSRARGVCGHARRAGCRYHGMGARNRRCAPALPRSRDRSAAKARLHPDRAMSEPLQRVLRADDPLTLAGVPTSFLPWLAADLARAVHASSRAARAVAIVADEAAMRALAETLPLFAPEVEILTLPV